MCRREASKKNCLLALRRRKCHSHRSAKAPEGDEDGRVAYRRFSMSEMFISAFARRWMMQIAILGNKSEGGLVDVGLSI